MFPSLRHLILFLWILLPVHEAVGNIITIDDYYRNVRWMLFENQEKMTLSSADSWAKGLNAGGYTDWGLPFTEDGKCQGWTYNDTDNDTKTKVTYSDLGHLYYTVKKYDSKVDTTPFLQHTFWLGTNKANQVSTYQDFNDMAWAFDFSTGLQFLQSAGVETEAAGVEAYAIAVRTDPLPASAVPEPNTALLFLTGILCLAYSPLSRKRLR